MISTRQPRFVARRKSIPKRPPRTDHGIPVRSDATDFGTMPAQLSSRGTRGLGRGQRRKGRHRHTRSRFVALGGIGDGIAIPRRSWIASGGGIFQPRRW